MEKQVLWHVWQVGGLGLSALLQDDFVLVLATAPAATHQHYMYVSCVILCDDEKKLIHVFVMEKNEWPTVHGSNTLEHTTTNSGIEFFFFASDESSLSSPL